MYYLAPPLAEPEVNWFFSSLAQAAAAIVGLIGAFVIASLLRERDIAARHHVRLCDRAAALAHCAQGVLAPREIFIELWERELGAALTQPLPRRVLLSLLPAFGGGASSGPTLVEANPADRVTLEGLLEQAHRLQARVNRRALLRWFHGEERAAPDLRVLTEMVQEARTAEGMLTGTLAPLGARSADALQELLVCAAAFSRARADARRALPLGTYRFAILLLSALAVSCVLMPLNQLDAPSSETRSVYIAAFAGGLVVLVGFMWQQVSGLASALSVREDELDSHVLGAYPGGATGCDRRDV